MTFDILRPSNYEHDENFAEKPVVHNLLHAFYRMIHRWYF